MKKTTFFLLGLALATTGAAFSETAYWVRAYGDPAILDAALASYDLDVAASTPRTFDLIADDGDLAALKANGVYYRILDTFDTSDAPPAEYTTYDELVVELNNLANTYPNICKLYDLGGTWQGRDILALKISNNPGVNDPNKDDILVDGNHHAREIMTVEVPLYLAKQICLKYPTDPDVKLIVDNVETWIVPMVNPDGHNHVFTLYNMWRKNRRDNGGGVYGVDLNRNYDYHWGEAGSSHSPSSDTYCGPSAFSEPEMQALRDLMNNAAHQFTYALNYHSYGRVMNYPWAYTASHPAEPHYQYYKDLAAYLLATLPGWEHGNDWENLGYVASGNAVDWQFDGAGHPHCYGFSFEIDGSFQPSAAQIPITCNEQYPVLIKLLKLGVCELAVDVTGFRAAPAAGAIKVTWEVADAGELSGFNLYRREKGHDAANGDYARLNDALIRGQSPYAYVDEAPTPGREYDYLLEAVDVNGYAETFGPASARAAGKTARSVALYQNMPNPAKDRAEIAYDVVTAGPVRFDVFDLAGRRVRGWDEVAREGRNCAAVPLVDGDGSPLAPGVYVYRLQANGETLTRRMVVAR